MGKVLLGSELRDVDIMQGKEKFEGVWIMHEPEQPPDFVLYYVHGESSPCTRSVVSVADV